MVDVSPTSMLAVVTDDAVAGRLRLADVARPSPGPGEVLVRVGAVSLNRGEVKTALAAPAGTDGSGPPAGTCVVGLAPFGGWSEYVAASPQVLAEVPAGVSLSAAATLPVAGLTARAALARGTRKAGQRVLVTGASGGVGVFALQLAALQGTIVTAAIRNPDNEPLVRRLGASQVAIGGDLAGAQGPYDLILESVGGQSLGAALGNLAPGGVCVVFGASAGATTSFDASKFRVGGTSLYGLAMQYEFQREPPSVGLADLLGSMAAGKLEAVIERRAPIADVARVAGELIERRFVGKAVLTLDDAAV